MEKTKKRNIIIAIICGVVIIVGIIASILLIIQKKFDMSPNAEATYNNHTKITIAGPDSVYSIVNNSNPTYYSNGTVKIRHATSGYYGIYSYASNSVIIGTGYTTDNLSAIELKSNNTSTGEHIFRTGCMAAEINNEFAYYNDEGNRLNISFFNKEKNENFGYIKQKKMSISEKRKGIKVTTKNKFSTEKIILSDAEYIESYVKNGVYNYEVWLLTDIEGNEYRNLYKVVDKQRHLVQTINNTLGSSTDLLGEVTLYFLKDGTPRLTSMVISENESGQTLLNLTVYDINFKEKNSTTLVFDDTLSTIFQVGNSLYYQYIIPSSEDEYDYSETETTSNGSVTNYYRVETYKFNLKNGKKDKVKFKYVITNTNTSFNADTALLNVRKIKSKTLQNEEMLLVNDGLKTKEINYSIDSITKITDDRYIVENSEGQYLIDETYELVCYLGDFDSFFTTSESVILTDTDAGYTYVCTLDGVVVKRYLSNEITNAYDNKYYIVEVETEVGETTRTDKYLERLGLREETPIYSQTSDSETYTYNGQQYVAYSDAILKDGIGVITRVRQNNSHYIYEFYNIHGKLLHTINNSYFTSPNRELTYWGYTDDSIAVLHIASNVGGIEYYLTIDR